MNEKYLHFITTDNGATNHRFFPMKEVSKINLEYRDVFDYWLTEPQYGECIITMQFVNGEEFHIAKLYDEQVKDPQEFLQKIHDEIYQSSESILNIEEIVSKHVEELSERSRAFIKEAERKRREEERLDQKEQELVT